MATPKTTVHGDVVPKSQAALELQATRSSEAEILAVQRKQKINMVWEHTQQFIAIVCIIAAVAVSVYIAITDIGDVSDRAYQFLTNAGLLVIGFYFGRTNHARPTGENKLQS